MITLSNIISDMLEENESNSYYFDALNEVGYHIHINECNEPKFFKNTKKTIRCISEKEFISAINSKCHGHSISENTYYDIVK